MPMEGAPFWCLTDKPSRYMITPMLKCVTPDVSTTLLQNHFWKSYFSPKNHFWKSYFVSSVVCEFHQLVEGELTALLIGVGTADSDALSSVLGTKKRSYTEYPA